jgi:hypothetical protein
MRTLTFILVRRVLGLVGLGCSPDAKDAKSRSCVTNYWSRAARSPDPDTPADRMILATLAKLLPRDRWPVLQVTRGVPIACTSLEQGCYWSTPPA